ncbi:MAG: flavodoxin [Tannerellaceae bacterium]|nr:flavodoxin [Tannerellaceae bacterium]MCD8262762.1 flavodoxin [Tannerellaceae bacterium]
MKKIGLFYGAGSHTTATIAGKIKNACQGCDIEIIAVENAGGADFEKYENIIAGAATWPEGELPGYWDKVMPEVASLDMHGKKVAIFGLGDQRGYPDNFVDGIGILARSFAARGATIVGYTSTEGYHFTCSRAVTNGQFMGLAINEVNQSELTDERIRHWIEQLKGEFALEVAE